MSSAKNKVATGAVLTAGVAALGVATAPAGVPLMRTLLLGDKPTPKAFAWLTKTKDPVGSWLGNIPEALAAEGAPLALLAWCAAIAAALALMVLYARSKQQDRQVAGGVLGDARLITSTAEIRRKNDFWDGEGEPPSAGLVLSSSRKGYLYDPSVPHFAVVGKTGSGKSWLVNLQTLHLCMARGWNLIVTGKEELLELTGDKAGELGYGRVVFDLRGYPGASRFNPLDLIVGLIEAGDVGEAQRAARQLAADLIPLDGGDNAYFPKAARDVLTACLLIVATADIPREQKNMASVCRMVAEGTTGEGKDPSGPLKDYIRGPEVGPGHPAYEPAAEFLSDGGLTTAGKNVLSTIKQALSIFSDAGVREVTATSDVAIEDIVRGKTVVYMHLLEEGSPYMAVMTAFFNQYWRVAQREAARNGGRLPRETAIVGDEWGNLPAVAALPEMVTLGRSYRLHVYCFTQDLKQWNKYSRPGDQNAGRDKILGSMGGKVALSLANPDDFQYFTRLAGKRTVRTRSTDTQRNGAGLGARGGTSEGMSEHADDLIHEWEWQGRVPVRDGIVVIKGGENGNPGREGVFQMPVDYASRTPAAAFFGLGDEDECDRRRVAFRHRMATSASSRPAAPEPWAPDFAADARDADDEGLLGALGGELAAWD